MFILPLVLSNRTCKASPECYLRLGTSSTLVVPTANARTYHWSCVMLTGKTCPSVIMQLLLYLLSPEFAKDPMFILPLILSNCTCKASPECYLRLGTSATLVVPTANGKDLSLVLCNVNEKITIDDKMTSKGFGRDFLQRTAAKGNEYKSARTNVVTRSPTFQLDMP
jgi:hypothetical protein